MNKRLPTREEFKEKIEKRFSSTKFSCMRCGVQNIEINEIQPYSTEGTQTALYVTALLLCTRCIHIFHVKILDQGIQNTDLYFDSTL